MGAGVAEFRICRRAQLCTNSPCCRKGMGGEARRPLDQGRDYDPEDHPNWSTSRLYERESGASKSEPNDLRFLFPSKE